MKILRNTIKIVLSSMLALFMFSCQSSKKDNSFLTIADQQVLPPLLSQVPLIEYSGIGIRYECESMFLHNTVVLQDNSASKKFCIRIVDDSSSASLKVKFPAGTYEVLLNEKAQDSNHSAFYLYIDGVSHRVYPNNPPSGDWELTTRSPVYFTLEESRTVSFVIRPNSDKEQGSTGMNLDFIQFVKR